MEEWKGEEWQKRMRKGERDGGGGEGREGSGERRILQGGEGFEGRREGVEKMLKGY